MGSSRSIQILFDTYHIMNDSLFINFSSDGMEIPQYLAYAIDRAEYYWDDDEYFAHNVVIGLYEVYPYTIGLSPLEVQGEYPTIVIDMTKRAVRFLNSRKQTYTFEEFIAKFKGKSWEDNDDRD